MVETGRTISGVEEAGFFADFADGTLLCLSLQTVLPRRTRPYPIRRQRPLLVNSLSHVDILPANHSISAQLRCRKIPVDRYASTHSFRTVMLVRTLFNIEILR